MRKNVKGFIAGLMATTMVISSSMVALAADVETSPASGSTSGSGELEGTVDTDVFKVVLPTIAENDTTFDFIVDPEGLIAATTNAAYEGKTFETDKTVYFNNVAADKVTDYSSKSDKLTITNKSTMKVDVSIAMAVTGIDGITLTEDNTFANDTNASLYLAVTDGTTTKALTSAGATFTSEIAAAPTDAYTVVYDETNGYSYGLTDAAKGDDYEGFSSLSFYMTGAANTAGDWSNLTDMAPEVTLTWSVAEHVDSAAPSIATTSYELTKGSALDIAVNFGKGDKAATGLASVTYTVPGGSATSLGSNYTFADGKITIKSTAVDFIYGKGGATVKVTFNDSANTAVDVTLTVPAE